MSKRLPKRFQYQQREKSNDFQSIRTTQCKIKTIDRSNLKVTTENGMKVQISCSANMVETLKNCLQEGDVVQIVSKAGIIQKCTVAEMYAKKYKVEQFVRLKQELSLVLTAEENVEKIMISQDMLEKKDIIFQSKTGPLSWFHLYYAQQSKMLGVEARLYYIAERLVAITFDMPINEL